MAVLLQQYEIENVPKRAIKGQTLVDFLAGLLVLNDAHLAIDLLNEEVMTLSPPPPIKDEKCTLMVLLETQQEKRKKIRRIIWSIKILFIYLNNTFILYFFSLTKVCSQNTTEYKGNTIEYKGLIT